LEASPATNPRVWNSGQLNPRGPRAAIDDVAYTRQLLDELQQQVPYDPQRVFLAGHSNGSSMALKLAAELSERFVAVGSVAGLVAVENPQPKRPLPTLYILGTQDPLMPLEGGEVKLPWATRQNPPVRAGLEKWATSLGCETTPEVVSDKDEVKTVVYPNKRANGPTLTVLYLEGHGHQWPGAKIIRRNPGGGPVNTTLDATDTIWKFFQSQPPTKQ
jgi:polyhydroxybutyrate depolymerase